MDRGPQSGVTSREFSLQFLQIIGHWWAMRRIYVRWVSGQVLRQSAMENVMGVLAQRVPSATLTWSTTRHQYLNSLLMQGLQRFETIDFLSGCIEWEGCLLYLSNSAILSRKAAPNKSTIQTALSVFGPHIQSLGVGILILLPCCRLIERERNNIRSRFAVCPPTKRTDQTCSTVASTPLYGHKQIHYEAMMIES